MLPPHPQLTLADRLVWQELHEDLQSSESSSSDTGSDDSGPSSVSSLNSDFDKDQGIANLHNDDGVNGEIFKESARFGSVGDTKTKHKLQDMNDPESPHFTPTIVTSWDANDMPGWIGGPWGFYSRWAQRIVRRPTDVVFLTHILIYLATSLPSALLLFYSFSWLRAILHWAMTAYACGPFTLMLHNHIHNNGVLAKKYHAFDSAWPYVLSPLMGHTWNSYYYHHVKHHHVENNGPGDLSSTIRYQRDEWSHFVCYVTRFIALIWIELPCYFYRKGKIGLAWRSFTTELSNYACIGLAAYWQWKASVFVLIVPLIQMRIGMMVGNWGQHALVDEADPDSDFRSSITLIDVPVGLVFFSPPVWSCIHTQSNRHCFNDGYHTSHHLNPRRHWRDHPAAFLQAKEAYSTNAALVFQHIDYIMLTVTLLRKDYLKLAACLVPLGDQTAMSQVELAAMLRGKTRRFTEADIQQKFGKLA